MARSANFQSCYHRRRLRSKPSSIWSRAAIAGSICRTVTAWRSLPRAYGAYAAVSLVFILYAGPREHPLTSALRYLVVVFPLFIELARLLAGRTRAALAVAAVFGCGLLAVTVQFARWWFVG